MRGGGDHGQEVRPEEHLGPGDGAHLVRAVVRELPERVDVEHPQPGIEADHEGRAVLVEADGLDGAPGVGQPESRGRHLPIQPGFKLRKNLIGY